MYVLGVAEVGAAPVPVGVLKDGRLNGESEGNIIRFAEAGGRGRGGVEGGVLVRDAGHGEEAVGVHGKVGCDLVNFEDEGNDEGLHRGRSSSAAEGVVADQEAVVHGAAA